MLKLRGMMEAGVVFIISWVWGIVFREGTRLWQSFMCLSERKPWPVEPRLDSEADLPISSPKEAAEYQEALVLRSPPLSEIIQSSDSLPSSNLTLNV